MSAVVSTPRVLASMSISFSPAICSMAFLRASYSASISFIVYDQVLRGDSAAALTLPTASSTPAATSAPAASTAAGSSASAAPATTSDGPVAGTWTVAADSVAGYRVREQLANLPAESDAVGRTDQITGSITLESSGSTTTLTAGAGVACAEERRCLTAGDRLGRNLNRRRRPSSQGCCRRFGHSDHVARLEKADAIAVDPCVPAQLAVDD